MRLILTIGVCGAVFLAGFPAVAQERLISEETSDGGFYVGTGVTKLQANEIVWAGNHRLSHLIWQSTAPVLRAGFDVNFADGWTFKANGSAAMGGDSHMEDYDWTDWDGPGGGTWSDNWDDWTHKSVHPDTRLDYYLALDAAIGYNVIHTAEFTANANVGLKYSDVKWTAYGGTGLHSNGGGFRNDPQAWADGTRVIDFNQRWPVAFAGIDTEYRAGAFSLGVDAKAGVTFSAYDIDNHYGPSGRTYYDYIVPAPVVQLGVDAGYAITDHADLFLAINYEKIFEARGHTDRYVTATGALEHSGVDNAGGSFESFSLTGGFKGQF